MRRARLHRTHVGSITTVQYKYTAASSVHRSDRIVCSTNLQGQLTHAARGPKLNGTASLGKVQAAGRFSLTLRCWVDVDKHEDLVEGEKNKIRTHGGGDEIMQKQTSCAYVPLQNRHGKNMRMIRFDQVRMKKSSARLCRHNAGLAFLKKAGGQSNPARHMPTIP